MRKLIKINMNGLTACLTIDEFSKIKNGEIFKIVERENTKFLAIKGDIEDWALYYDDNRKSEDEIKNYGHKAYEKDLIREIIPCDDEVFKLYRY